VYQPQYRQTYQPLKLIQKYEHLFDGTLGEFNIAPISLQPQDQESKPVHVRLYTIPKVAEQQLLTKIARLVNIGVLEKDFLFGNKHIGQSTVVSFHVL
jgi:hypothetical protein